jgi:hypothetical protein
MLQDAVPAAREASRDVLPQLQSLLADEAGALRPGVARVEASRAGEGYERELIPSIAPEARYKIRQSYPLPADEGGEKGAYAILSPEGQAVGGAHITISPDGRTANIDNIWAGNPDLARNIVLDPTAAEAANTLGPRAMRQLAQDFFRENPTVQEIMGERVSGAREAPGGASITREQVSVRGILGRLMLLLGGGGAAAGTAGGLGDLGGM